MLAIVASPEGAPKPTKLAGQDRAEARRHLPFESAARITRGFDQDASIPWRESDEIVEFGVVTIDKTVRDSLDAQKKLLFLPTNLIEGIEPSTIRCSMSEPPPMRSRFHADILKPCIRTWLCLDSPLTSRKG
ncbi:MAG TPA: hypothetical protein VME69_13095 [Methylocella sp.]|nr:hypothetical protein [Methylocella sp.]